MIKTSPLLHEYKNLEGGILRKKLGKGYSWNNLINARQIYRIEYALWYADQIAKDSCPYIGFYTNYQNSDEVDNLTMKGSLKCILNGQYEKFSSLSHLVEKLKKKSRCFVVIGDRCEEEFNDVDVNIYGKLLKRNNEKVKVLSSFDLFRGNISEEINKTLYTKKTVTGFMLVKN